MDDKKVRAGYYEEVEALLKKRMPGKVRKVVIFDHTIRRRKEGEPRQPVQQVHVDQTVVSLARGFLGGEVATGRLS